MSIELIVFRCRWDNADGKITLVPLVGKEFKILLGKRWFGYCFMDKTWEKELLLLQVENRK